MIRHSLRAPARRPRHRPAPVALAAGAAVLALAGCGSTGGTGHTSGTGSATSTAGSSHAADGKGAGGCGDAVLDLAADRAHRGVCVGVGRTLRVLLPPGWSVGSPPGDALARTGDGVYRGAAPGTAELSGAMRCPPPEPGQMSCMMIGTWHVTVEVR